MKIEEYAKLVNQHPGSIQDAVNFARNQLDEARAQGANPDIFFHALLAQLCGFGVAIGDRGKFMHMVAELNHSMTELMQDQLLSDIVDADGTNMLIV